jgi:hypothetical protein
LKCSPVHSRKLWVYFRPSKLTKVINAVINKSAILKDVFNDQILTIIKLLNAKKRWNKEAIALKAQLIKTLKAEHYVYFTGCTYRYHVSAVGGSYLYDVPLYKRGNLLNFRGKRIRIICIHSGSHSNRGYMAGVICDSPPDKIISKVDYNYTFPDYTSSHKILYKSPRYMALKVNKQMPIFLKNSPTNYIDGNLWDTVLIDGKEGTPVAIFKHNADGTVKGKRVSWTIDGNYFPTLKDAINNFK